MFGLDKTLIAIILIPLGVFSVIKYTEHMGAVREKEKEIAAVNKHNAYLQTQLDKWQTRYHERELAREQALSQQETSEESQVEEVAEMKPVNDKDCIDEPFPAGLDGVLRK